MNRGLMLLAAFALLAGPGVKAEPQSTVHKQRVVVVGFDGMYPEMLEKFVKEGALPNFARLMREGAFARAIPAAPADTPTNWSTIATGAYPGSHGLNSFGIHHSGDPFEFDHNVMGNLHPRIAFPEPPDQTFNGECLAEYLWQQTEKLGLKSILVNFPGGWPPNLKSGIVVNGSGPYASPVVKLTLPQRYSTAMADADAIKIKLAPARGWRDLPRSSLPPLEAQFTDSETRITYDLLLVATSGAAYDRVFIASQKSAAAPVAVLSQGESSPWLERKFHVTITGPQAEVFLALAEYKRLDFDLVGRFKFRVLELASDGSRLVLERGTVYNPHDWAYPQQIADQLIDYFDAQPQAPAAPISIFSPLAMLNENTTTMGNGIAETTRYLTSHHDWDFLWVQMHEPDGINHNELSGLDSGWSGYSEKDAPRYWEDFRKQYQLLDRLLGNVLDCCVDQNTLVVVVSDHGALPVRKVVRLGDYLVEAGLLTYKDSPDGKDLVVDWGRTKVALGDHPLGQSIWVNLKGRDPQGIVELADYDEVRNQVIHVLQSIRDPGTNQPVIELAAKIEDASVWGDWGPRFGDVVYFFTPGYSNDPSIHTVGPIEKEALSKDRISADTSWYLTRRTLLKPILRGAHHAYLPTARLGEFSNEAIFIAAGPDIKQGYRRPRPISLADVTPTVCYWRKIPVPANSEGGAILDIFKVPR